MGALTGNRATAAADFRRARRRAALQRILSRITGKSAELFAYEDVRKRLRGQELAARELRDIPLKAIVGSTGRYREFTKSFLPLGTINRGRWIRVKLAMLGLKGVSPIEVYQIGDAYFVQDGNHRVSVAREMGFAHIHAHVTPVKTKVFLSPDTEPDELILKAERTAFLEATQIDELPPDADLRVTSPGQYRVLQEHIDVHRYYMAEERQREVPYMHAVRHWYETVYLPVVKPIRERGMLCGFPKRTQTDLYLWISAHQAELEKQLGWEISADRAASDLTIRYRVSPRVSRGGAQERLEGTLSRPRPLVVPDTEPYQHLPSAATGAPLTRSAGRVVHDILVAIDGGPAGWLALEQAIVVAQRERARQC